MATGTFVDGKLHGKCEWSVPVNGIKKKLHAQFIKGPWETGLTLDKYIIHSIPDGENEYVHTEFNTTCTEIGKLLNRFKYKNDIKAGVDLLPFACTVLSRRRIKFDVIVPIPSSTGKTVTA